ncbi:DNA translocase FtsK 4TM domain-containing protein, partial [Nocardioides massiliensis]
MATRTSSPPGSRSKSTSASGRGSGSRTRASGSKPKTSTRSKPASKSAARPAPRAVRNGPGPIATIALAIGRALTKVWLGIAHVVGGGARAIGHSAREIEPEQRRDGIGLLLIALATVVAAAVWWHIPGWVGEVTRTIVTGSVGLVGWFVPLLLCLVAWRNMRDPETNGPAGRQVIGWTALLFGVLGIVHISNGAPRPVEGDVTPLQDAGGAIGFVVSSLLLDLLQTSYVVVPLLLLLAVFGVLVITATPVYQVPARLRALGDQMMGRTAPAEGADG